MNLEHLVAQLHGHHPHQDYTSASVSQINLLKESPHIGTSGPLPTAGPHFCISFLRNLPRLSNNYPTQTLSLSLSLSICSKSIFTEHNPPQSPLLSFPAPGCPPRLQTSHPCYSLCILYATTAEHVVVQQLQTLTVKHNEILPYKIIIMMQRT